MNPSLSKDNKLVFIIPDKSVSEEPINLSLPGGSQGSHPDIRIEAGVSTRVKIILDERISPAQASVQGRLEVYLAKGACVSLFHFQELEAQARSSWEQIFYLKQHSNLETMLFASGGGVIKNKLWVNFQEEHAFCSLKGLSLLKGKADALYDLFADHQAAHGISRQHYKNILAGSARSDFQSLVHVAHGAPGTDTRQLCRNLLLSELAQGNASPQLKISTDDVACSHGATTGQLDAQELFYLRSRGLTLDLARYLMITGFANEVAREIQDGEMKERVLSLIGRELQGIC